MFSPPRTDGDPSSTLRDKFTGPSTPVTLVQEEKFSEFLTIPVLQSPITPSLIAGDDRKVSAPVLSGTTVAVNAVLKEEKFAAGSSNSTTTSNPDNNITDYQLRKKARIEMTAHGVAMSKVVVSSLKQELNLEDPVADPTREEKIPYSIIGTSKSTLEFEKAKLEIDPKYVHQLQVDTSIDEDDDLPTPSGSNNTCAVCGPARLDELGYDLVCEHWIQCDVCKKWYHQSCADVDEIESYSINLFHCKSCIETSDCGPSIDHEFLVPHRLNYEDLNEMNKPIQVGSKQWIAEFIADKEFTVKPPAYGVEVVEDGFEFDDKFDRSAEWKTIYLVKNRRGLDVNMPHEDFGIKDCINLIGPDQTVDTIDVYRQISKSMKIDRFYEKWCAPERPRLYNILSMEFSSTPMTQLVWPPRIVRELSWVHSFWPESVKKKEKDGGSISTDFPTTDKSVSGYPTSSPSGRPGPVNYTGQMSPLVNEDDVMKKPEVSMFCLLGMKGSYTDFHVDFGGSSVWYHVFKGKKIFYVAAPTDRNMRVYREYQNLTENKQDKWLGDDLDEGELGRVEVCPGETLLIPAGWIHAVLTPEDSVVFGGNFIHSLNIKMQLQVYDIECESNIDKKFQFPHFELTNWYAAKAVYEDIRECNNENSKCADYLFEGAVEMSKCLSIWLKRAQIHGSNALEKFGPPILRALLKEIQRQKNLRAKSSKRKQGSESPEYGAKKGRAPKSSLKMKFRIPANGTGGSNVQAEKTNAVADDVPTVGDVRVKELDINEKEQKIVGQMFSRRTSSGRVPKPSQAFLEVYGEQIDRERQKVIESGEDMSPERASVDYSLQMDALVAAEEKRIEMEEQQRKNRKKGINVKAIGTAVVNGVPKPKKSGTTVKQRLAKKLKF